MHGEDYCADTRHCIVNVIKNLAYLKKSQNVLGANYVYLNIHCCDKYIRAHSVTMKPSICDAVNEGSKAKLVHQAGPDLGGTGQD